MEDVGVWQGVAMDSLKFYPGPPCLTLLCPAGGSTLKRALKRFMGGPPVGWVAYGHLLPPGHPTLYAYGWKMKGRLPVKNEFDLHERISHPMYNKWGVRGGRAEGDPFDQTETQFSRIPNEQTLLELTHGDNFITRTKNIITNMISREVLNGSRSGTHCFS
jgi:hypothetical protein